MHACIIQASFSSPFKAHIHVNIIYPGLCGFVAVRSSTVTVILGAAKLHQASGLSLTYWLIDYVLSPLLFSMLCVMCDCDFVVNRSRP